MGRTRVDLSTPIGRVVADLDRVRRPLPAADGIAVFVDMYRQVTALLTLFDPRPREDAA